MAFTSALLPPVTDGWATPALRAPVVASSTAKVVSGWLSTLVNRPPTNSVLVAGSTSRARTPFGSSSSLGSEVITGANSGLYTPVVASTANRYDWRIVGVFGAGAMAVNSPPT